MRYFIHCDNNFRNIKMMQKKLQFLSSPDDEDETNVVNFFYGFNYSKINNILTNLNVRIQRRNYTEIVSCLNFSDVVILFHNFIEYNNGIESIIQTCLDYGIPLLIFSEHLKASFLISKDKELVISKKIPKFIKNDTVVSMKDFNFIPYRFNPSISRESITTIIKTMYDDIKEDKLNNSVKQLNSICV